MKTPTETGRIRSSVARAWSGTGLPPGDRNVVNDWVRVLSSMLVLFALALALFSWWAIGSVRRSIKTQSSATLQSILVAGTESLEMWLARARDVTVHQASLPAVAAAAQSKLVHPDSSEDQDADGLPLPDDNRWNDEPGQIGWVLINLRGEVVSASDADWIGIELPIPTDAMEQVLALRPTVSRPFPMPVAIINRSDHYSIAGGPVLAAMAPIEIGSVARGALCLLIDPVVQHQETVAKLRSGQSGQTYLVDRGGVMLSPSRYEAELRVGGLLNPDPKIVSPLNVAVRDPQHNILQDGRFVGDIHRQPLTKMADQLTRGGTGIDSDGYRDYRGVQVIGAWQWLPEHGLGIATEMETAEAFYAARLMGRWLYGLSGLMLLVGFALRTIPMLSSGSLRNRWRPLATPLAGANSDLGNYQLDEVIGRGGMGLVYRGRHQMLRRDVAIKVLTDEVELTELLIARFEREVQMTARLQHPNTIDIYDFGRTTDGTFFYVMEYVDGITLQELVDQYGRQPPARVIHLLLQICGSLSEAHHLGMIHRDIKPSNILLTARAGVYDMVKVLDFGLVKQLDDPTEQTKSPTELTQSDGITGTPMYMSPESVRDAATAEAQSDLYAVGAVGYLLLTGQPLFDATSSVDICVHQLSDMPRRPSERIGVSLPEDLQNVLMSCLRKSPEERPLSADDLADSLRHCQDANRWSAADALHWWEVGAH